MPLAIEDYEQVLYRRYYDALRWRNLWTILIFALASAIIIFLIIAIFYFLREEWLPGAVVMLGTIVQGAAVKWVADNRKKAVNEEKDALRLLKEFNEKKKKLDSLIAVPKGKRPSTTVKGKASVTATPVAKNEKIISDLHLELQQLVKGETVQDLSKMADDYKLLGNIR